VLHAKYGISLSKRAYYHQKQMFAIAGAKGAMPVNLTKPGTTQIWTPRELYNLADTHFNKAVLLEPADPKNWIYWAKSLHVSGGYPSAYLDLTFPNIDKTRICAWQRCSHCTRQWGLSAVSSSPGNECEWQQSVAIVGQVNRFNYRAVPRPRTVSRRQGAARLLGSHAWVLFALFSILCRFMWVQHLLNI